MHAMICAYTHQNLFKNLFHVFLIQFTDTHLHKNLTELHLI